MRILHIIHSLDPRSGGPSNALRGLVAAQVARGEHVSIAATSVQSAEPWESPAHFRSKILAEDCFQHVNVKILPAYGRRRPWSRFGFAPTCARELKRHFRDAKTRPDVVHIHGVFSHLTSVAARLAARSGVPFILRPAGCLDQTCMVRGSASLKSLFTRLLLRRELRLAGAIHATSEAEANELSHWATGDRIVTIPHGVSMPPASITSELFTMTFPSVKGRRCILFMGRVHAIKRTELLAQALSRLLPQHPSALLVIAGHDAGGMAALVDQIQSLKLQDNVLFTGFLDGAMKQSALRTADVFASPSAHENYGVAVVEAMASAVPILVTPGVAAHQFVDESGCGRTVESTPEAIAEALNQILNGDIQTIGQRGADYVRTRLSWEAVIGQIDAVYRQVIGRTVNEHCAAA